MKKKRRWLPWAAAAACLALLAAGAALYRGEHPYPVRYVQAFEHPVEIARVPRWEELEIYQQYGEVAWNGARYSVRGAEVPAARLGARLGGAQAAGRDEYDQEDGLRMRDVEVYAIEGLAGECAVAVRYEAGGGAFAAVNAYYRPETLGQFVDDLNLRDNLAVRGAECVVEKPLSGPADIRFEDVPVDRLWALLDTGLAAENTWRDGDALPDELLGLSIDVPLLGYENISLSLRADGSVTTNILDTGKRFQLDAAAAQDFADYVRTQCPGYEVIAVESSENIPE